MALFTEKERIEKMRTFGNPDSSVEITSPSLWIAIAGGFFVIIALFIWSVTGSISNSVTMKGVYVGNGYCVCFADLDYGKVISQRMSVKINPGNASVEEYGSITGAVDQVDDYDTDYEEAYELLGSQRLAGYFLEDKPAYYVVCKLEPNPDTVSGFNWTSKKGKEVELKSGTFVTARVDTDSFKPIKLIFPNLL